MNYFDLCETKALLGSEIIEEPDEVIDVFLGALDIKDEKTRIYKMETCNTTDFILTAYCGTLNKYFSQPTKI